MGNEKGGGTGGWLLFGRWFRTVAIDVCLHFNVAVVLSSKFPVCKAQLIGDWYENR